VQVIDCQCGAHVQAESDDELVAKVEEHVQERHPELVGEWSREQILDMAHSQG